MFIDLKVKAASWIWTWNSFRVRGLKRRRGMTPSSAPASLGLFVPGAGEFGFGEGKSQPKNFLLMPLKYRFCFCGLISFLSPPPPPTLSSAALPTGVRLSSEGHRQLLGSRDTSHPRCICTEAGK